MKFSDFKKSIDDKAIHEGPPGESEKRIKNLELILDIVKTINHSLMLDDVLELVLKSAIKLTNSERGFVVLRNLSGELEYKLGIDNKNELVPEKQFNVSTTVVHDVFYTGQSKFIESAQSDTNNDPSKSILKLELQTILCSPLITDDKKIGVIYVDSRHLQKIRAREITDTFEILAGQAAAAIRNAQLYNGQINAFNALQDANTQLIVAERNVLKQSIDAEIGQSLQGLVHLALLETESMMRTIEKLQKNDDVIVKQIDPLFFDRLKLKTKVSIDCIRSIQKYATALMETAIMELDINGGDINKTIQSVIRYISPMKKFGRITFKTEFGTLPQCQYDSEQIQHLLVHLFSNSAEAKSDATIFLKTDFENGRVVITIADNGPGIPTSILPTIFDIPSSKKSGYGLFLCKSIIDRHAGSIKVLQQSTGTSIQFLLPT
ncbi:MAG: GAF domain-containing sensor histidine kinase [Ignavibacteriaceae bacterium]|nr:GAF domain-containing sensor histidine kinase [Ignavibacteriaceae bacterium]